MKRVAIVDYGMSNLDSISRAVERCGAAPVVTDQEPDIQGADAIILPGVGSFQRGMDNIRARGLDRFLERAVRQEGRPLLGICLGMQLLAARGSEGGGAEGLGWIEGEVIRLVPAEERERIPHMGWNELEPVGAPPLLEGIEAGRDVYFVHSYHLAPDDEGDVLAWTPYCGRFASAVGRGNVWGVQFHPEKSQRAGFRILRNFLGCEAAPC